MNRWQVLARLAQMVLRGRASVRRLNKYVHRVGQRPGFALDVEILGEDVEYHELQDGSPAEDAEALATMWAEESRAIERPRRGDPSVRGIGCPTCGVNAQTWCRPTHDGERPAGDWVHPARRLWHEQLQRCTVDGGPELEEWRPDPRAIATARDLVERRDVASLLYGLDRVVQNRVELMARHILAVDRRDRAGAVGTAYEPVVTLSGQASEAAVAALREQAPAQRRQIVWDLEGRCMECGRKSHSDGASCPVEDE